MANPGAGISTQTPLTMDHDTALGNVTGASGKQALNVVIDNTAFAANGVYGAKTITTTPALACVSVINRPGRFTLFVRPIDGDLYWGFTNSVSSSNGMKILASELATWLLSDVTTIYLVSTGSVDTRIVEV